MARKAYSLITGLSLFMIAATGCLADEGEAFNIILNPSVTNSNKIDEGVMSQARGRVSINSAAGENNQQFNGAGISIGDKQANVTVSGRQDIQYVHAPQKMRNSVSIEENAFSDTRGVLSINQVSGNANSQANAIAISFGMQSEVFADIELEQTGTVIGLDDMDNGMQIQDQVGIDESAFSNAAGIIQLNQSAGVGNRSANTFGIRIIDRTE